MGSMVHLDAVATRPFDAQELKQAFGHFATGVSIITGLQASGEPYGLTVSSFQALSLDPALILYSVRRGAASLDFLTVRKTFGVSVLCQGQEWIARQFAERRPDRYSNVTWTPGHFGSPLIDNAIASFECDVWSTYEGGDHVIVVGRVCNLAAGMDGPPLVYFRGRFLPDHAHTSS